MAHKDTLAPGAFKLSSHVCVGNLHVAHETVWGLHSNHIAKQAHFRDVEPGPCRAQAHEVGVIAYLKNQGITIRSGSKI